MENDARRGGFPLRKTVLTLYFPPQHQLGEGVYVRNGLSHTQANLFLNCTLKGLLV